MAARWKPGDHWRSPVTSSTKSQNSKTRGIQITYASQASCPPDCAIWDRCYAGEEHGVGFMPLLTRRLNSNTTTDPVEIAREEAALIDRMDADLADCRVHGVGDCKTRRAANILGASMVRFDRRSRTGKCAYTYTHGWRVVPLQSWRGARVIASVHNRHDIAAARRQGYRAFALAHDERHPTHKAYAHPDVLGSALALPCPAQFGLTDCGRCNVCKNPDEIMAGRYVVAFQPDQIKKGSINANLRALDQPQ